MLEDTQTEAAEGHGREGGVQWTDKIFVEPLRFFNLEADARNRGEIFLGEIYYEADAEVVQPC